MKCREIQLICPLCHPTNQPLICRQFCIPSLFLSMYIGSSLQTSNNTFMSTSLFKLILIILHLLVPKSCKLFSHYCSLPDTAWSWWWPTVWPESASRKNATFQEPESPDFFLTNSAESTLVQVASGLGHQSGVLTPKCLDLFCRS